MDQSFDRGPVVLEAPAQVATPDQVKQLLTTLPEELLESLRFHLMNRDPQPQTTADELRDMRLQVERLTQQLANAEAESESQVCAVPIFLHKSLL